MGNRSPALHTARAALVGLAAGVALIVVRPASADTSLVPMPAVAPVATVSTTPVTAVTDTAVASTAQATTAVAGTAAPVTTPVAATVAQVTPQVPAESVIKTVKAVAPVVLVAKRTSIVSPSRKRSIPARTTVPQHVVAVAQPVARARRAVVSRGAATPAKLPKSAAAVRHSTSQPTASHVRRTAVRSHAAVAPRLGSAALAPAPGHTAATDATSSGAASGAAPGSPTAAGAREFSLPAALPALGAWPAAAEQPQTQHPLAFERPG